MNVIGHQLQVGDYIQFLHRGSLVTQEIRSIRRGRAYVRIRFANGSSKLFSSNKSYTLIPGGRDGRKARVPRAHQGAEVRKLQRYRERLQR